MLWKTMVEMVEKERKVLNGGRAVRQVRSSQTRPDIHVGLEEQLGRADIGSGFCRAEAAEGRGQPA